MQGLEQLSAVLTNLAYALVFLLIGLSAIVAFGYAFLLWLRNRNREEYSLSFVTLEVALPRDNEIKIDAAEQLFASLYSVKNEEWYSFLQSEHAVSFEIVGRKEDIRFYVSVPHELMELVEKQIHGAYPGAEIKSVDEFSIFDENGKVAFESLVKSTAGYYPIQSFRDLATDPLSSITSFFAKMRDGEGAILQVIVSPASHSWSNKAHGYISKSKKDESNPEKASYSVDPKSLEAAIEVAKKSNLKPRGIIAVDLFGQPADYDAINKIAQRHALFTIADSAQGFGGVYHGKQVPVIADVTTEKGVATSRAER